MVSISRKDRAAIGLAAKAVGEVYWLAERGGEFITSEFYHSEYPTWITQFNTTTMPLVYSDTVWESTIPPEALSLTRPDTSRWELQGEHTAFPHVASDLVDGAGIDFDSLRAAGVVDAGIDQAGRLPPGAQ